MAPSNHRIPRVYKEGAKILKEVMLTKRGLKDVIYSNRNKMLHKKLFVLLDKYLDNQNSINKFIQDTSLSQSVKDEFVVKILCTELLHGRKCLPSIENNTMNIVNRAFENHCAEDCVSDNNSNIPTCDKKTVPWNRSDSISDCIAAKKKLRYVRINTLMISIEEAVEQLLNDGFVQLPNARSYDEFLDTVAKYTGRSELDAEVFIQDYHLSDVLVFLQSSQFHNYALYKSGSLFLQDKASCFPTHLLSPPPHSVVFDTCAAPGNKTLHLAAYMQNQGKVYAVDKDPKRFKYMTEVVDLAQGSQVVKTILSDIFEIKMADYTDVEYVLVDPSCSGTGITERAKIDNNLQMSDGRIKNLAGFQKDLLKRVCSYFPNVKRVVYCTCSVREEENEQVVEDVVRIHGARWDVEDLTQHPALDGWKHFGSEKYTHGRKCFYALPSDYCTGFFAAVLNRREVTNEEVAREDIKRSEKQKPDEEMGEKYGGKCHDSSLNDEIETEDGASGERRNKKKKHKRKDFEMEIRSEDVENSRIGDPSSETTEELEEKSDELDRKKKKKNHKRKNLEMSDVENGQIEDSCSGTVQEFEEKSDDVSEKKKKKHKRKDVEMEKKSHVMK